MENRTHRVVSNMEKQPFMRRGAIYRWLRKNYRDLSHAFDQTEAGWVTVVADMIRDGVMGARGQPPNRKSAARVWARVRRDMLEADRRRLTGLGSKKLSSVPMPTKTNFTQPHEPAKAPTPFAPTPISPVEVDHSQMTVAERKADLRRVIDKRSGR